MVATAIPDPEDPNELTVGKAAKRACVSKSLIYGLL